MLHIFVAKQEFEKTYVSLALPYLREALLPHHALAFLHVDQLIRLQFL